VNARGPLPASGRCRVVAADVPPGRSAKVTLRHGGRLVEGFIVNAGGTHAAYVNRCPHVGTSLDLWPNEFFSEDGRTLVCSTHGAVFEPTTGRCIAGPCVGDALAPLPLERDGDYLVVG